MSILPSDLLGDCYRTDIVIVGAGACGMTAALAARERGAEVVLIERDGVPAGSTSLSAGLIPAAGTRFQRDKGIEDDAALFAADIMAKNHGTADPEQVALVARLSGATVEWLADAHAIPFDVVDNFLYPGHSRLRMHATPRRSGAELIDFLRSAVERAGVEIVTSARVESLHTDDAETIDGVSFTRADGSIERLAARAVVLACNGYGGDKALVAEHIPQMREALYFGHPGNTGDAVRWGAGLGAVSRDLGAYQGHGSVAAPHGILISWATVMEGGFQINLKGERFSNEAGGYSEQAVSVLAQPDGIAFTIFDQRIAAIAAQFEDFRNADSAGAIMRAPTLEELAARIGVDARALIRTAAAVDAARSGAPDAFGRPFAGLARLEAPYCAVRVTGALFHTQGGLAIDQDARVVRRTGRFTNLFAGGGAARGVSGCDVSGYLSGNGLVTAVTLGRLAGASAARVE